MTVESSRQMEIQADQGAEKHSRGFACPACGRSPLEPFYQVKAVPAYSVRLLHSAEEAIGCARGDLELAFCPGCAFISNTAFREAADTYSAGYEATQAYSPTFDAFARRLASDIIERHNLRNRTVLEIGCGMGEFLALLCEAGDNRGIGFDPAYLPGRISTAAIDRMEFHQEFFPPPDHHSFEADAVICKMTLEHIPHVREFIRSVRGAMDERSGALVFFQVPDVTRILEEGAFWDFYYEHCSYFSPASLQRLFSSCSFEVLSLKSDYAGQYLLIEARPSCSNPVGEGHHTQVRAIEAKVRDFSTAIGERLRAWQHFLNTEAASGRRTVLWGGGSKGVAFLTTLGITRQIGYVVDINPHKNGTYMAGTGQQIVSPEALREIRPDTVIVMNPIYEAEIAGWLADAGLRSALLQIDRTLSPGIDNR